MLAGRERLEERRVRGGIRVCRGRSDGHGERDVLIAGRPRQRVRRRFVVKATDDEVFRKVGVLRDAPAGWTEHLYLVEQLAVAGLDVRLEVGMPARSRR